MSYNTPPSEPVAVVGSSCRFAGGVSSPSELWDLLKSPPELSREVPSNRFSIQGFFHQDGEHHGTTNSPKGYWLDADHRVFDTSFFNITPREAEAIDPQQRMLLEVVYEALESAGYTLQQYSGQKVAVFAGIMTADYDTLSQRDDITASQYHATGNARSIISNRISYFYNFHGPSMTIDTACSSSLVALHQAVLSLRSGESVMACVTGANLMLTPEQFIVESSLHMLSPSGRSRMWDADADGYARGEGVAALLLKPLSRALADGDNIQAIIRETGVNSDGRTKGITMPNPAAQAALIRSTYERAGLDLRREDHRCQYFEAHGTGTHAGDPREAAAIAEAFFGTPEEQEQRVQAMQAEALDRPAKLLVGSVKTVVGHTEGAAGLAGILKVIQAMRHGEIPPNLHLSRLNPSILPFYDNLQIPTSVVPWPLVKPGHPLRASVNSFGFGGTNSHAIVERYTPVIHDPVGRHFSASGPMSPSPHALIPPGNAQNQWLDVPLPLVLSANSQQSLLAMATDIRAFISVQPDSDAVKQVLWHLFANRTAFPFRLAVPSGSKDTLVESLDTILRRASASSAAASLGLRSGPAKDTLRILGVFTGQGAQWATMAKGLLLTCKSFEASISGLDRELQSCPHPPEWTLAQEIMAEGPSSRVNIAAIAQPLSTALQIALVDLLARLGITFHTVVGHSSGEIGAAYAAGRLSARDAILIAYFRGRCAHLARGIGGAKGGMVAVGMSRTEAEDICATEQFRGRISLAASNSPTSTTISGDLEAIHELQHLLSERGTFARVLVIDTAYHSHHMAPAADVYRTALRACNIAPLEALADGNAVKWFSSVHDDSRRNIATDELAADYWVANMRRPVLFREALEAAYHTSSPFDAVLEVGPHPQLKGPATQTLKALTQDKAPPYTGLLDRGEHDAVSFSGFVGFMWTHFGPKAVRLESLTSTRSRAPVDATSLDSKPCTRSAPESLPELMPRYAWDHSQVHYLESRVSRQYHFRTHAPHELLGVRTRDDTEFELRWRNILKTESIPWVEHHRFQGQALLPASAYCVMALDAARVLLNGRPASVVELEDLEFLSGITIEPGSYGVEVLFTLAVTPPPKERRRKAVIEATFTVTSAFADGSSPMRKNFQGSMRILPGEPFVEALPRRPESHAETMTVGSEAFYHMMSGLDLDYTGPFRGIKTIERRLDFASTTLRKAHPDDSTSLSLSPAVLDTCFQSCFSAFSSAGDRALWTSFLPRSVSKIRFNLAACDSKVISQDLVVDAYLTDFRPMSKEGASTISGDLCIYNDNGEMEIQVEGMTISSFAATKPENDYELYLHTVMRMDPEDEIITMAPDEDTGTHRVLTESCERVASFYGWSPLAVRSASLSPASASVLTLDTLSPHRLATFTAWPDESEESLSEFVTSSPFRGALELLSSLGKNLPDVLSAMLPTIVYEARTQLQFQTHLSNIVRQIAHRYPRMNVLGVTDPETDFYKHILAGLESSFASLTIVPDSDGQTTKRSRRLNIAENVRDKVFLDNGLDLLGDEDGSGVDEDPRSHASFQPVSNYDLVVLSTSLAEQRRAPSTILKRVRSVMKPGAFLVLVQASASPLRDRLRRCAAGYTSAQTTLPLTPPDWPDILEACGFVRGPRQGDQYYPPGFAVTIRQTECAEKTTIRHPLAGGLNGAAGRAFQGMGNRRKVVGKTLVIGGGICERTATLAVDIVSRLESVCDECSRADFFDSLASEEIATCSSIIILTDLDQPTLSTMTAERLEALRALMRPDMVALWVTHGARDRNPEHAASFGFARTLMAEIPSLKLQSLDLQDLWGHERGASQLIVETFARLALRDAPQQERRIKEGALLWTHEPEIYVDQTGRRLVPRVLPYRPGIDRVNATRRIVSRAVNTIETCVEIVPTQSSADGSTHYGTRLCDAPPARGIPGRAVVQVHYSSVDVLNLGYNCLSHVCVGRDVTSGRVVVALSQSNASFVQVPVLLTHELGCDDPAAVAVADSAVFAGLLLRYLAVLSILDRASMHKRMLLVEPDEQLFECMQEVVSKGQSATLSEQYPLISACTTDLAIHDRHTDWAFVHPCSTPRTVKSLFSAGGAGDVAVFDFLADAPDMSEMILDCISDDSEYHSGFSLLGSAGHLPSPAGEDSQGIDTMLAKAVALARAKVLTTLDTSIDSPRTETALASETRSTSHTTRHTAATTVQELTQGSRPVTAFQVVDWRAQRTVLHAESHLVGPNMLRPYKTYVLVGITRDLGQSLCRLFIEQGARNIVLASRNPDMHPRWRDELEAYVPPSSAGGGRVRIRIEKMDVTDYDDVVRFRDEIARDMPPVAGIVNGAMVLEDRVFAQMSLETLHRVMRPKTVGSANLDRAFADCEMEFFVMTSSFAAVGGHAGQSNYAAANMYMNGLAADRRRRGLAASVLNIGVIYGLGFLHREKDNLYQGLEREGYPPVSERDVHHMFLEAIAAGRAPCSSSSEVEQILDLTTGLSRYRVDDANPLHWHRDPRFSHYTVDGAGGCGHDDDKDASGGGSVRDHLNRAATEAEVRAIVAAEVAGKLQALLRLPGAVPLDASVSDLGVDSLMAVEIRAWIYKVVGKDVPVMKILGSSSIEKLCANIAAAIVADREVPIKPEDKAIADQAQERPGSPVASLPVLSSGGSATSGEGEGDDGAATRTGSPTPSRPSTMESEGGEMVVAAGLKPSGLIMDTQSSTTL